MYIIFQLHIVVYARITNKIEQLDPGFKEYSSTINLWGIVPTIER